MAGGSEHGYSGKPLAQKLGVRAGHTLALINAPPEALELVSPLPEGVDVRYDLRRRPDIALAFFERESELRARIPVLRRAIFPDQTIWIAWPKRASGVQTDIDENLVRALAIEHNLVDTKVAAVDETWSGLRLVVPIKFRDGPA